MGGNQTHLSQARALANRYFQKLLDVLFEDEVDMN